MRQKQKRLNCRRGWCLQILLIAILALLSLPAKTHAKDVMVIGGLVAPPYIIIDEKGSVSGVAVELIKQALAPLDIEPQFRISNWARAFKSATSGKIDALIPAIKSPDREEHLAYTETPLAHLQMALLHQKGSSATFDGSMESLKGSLIGRIRNARVSKSFDEAAKTGLFNIEERNSFGLLALAVAHGRIDFMAGDELMGLWGAAENGVLDRLEISHPHLGSVPVYLAISRKSPIANRVAEISENLARAKKSQDFQRAIKSYGKFLRHDIFQHLLRASED